MQNENPVLRSAFDLIKYHVISKINTGDRTLDNLINGLFLSCLGIVYTYYLNKTDVYEYLLNNLYPLIGLSVFGGMCFLGYKYKAEIRKRFEKTSEYQSSQPTPNEDFSTVATNINKNFIENFNEWNFNKILCSWETLCKNYPFLQKFLGVYYNIHTNDELEMIEDDTIFWTDTSLRVIKSDDKIRFYYKFDWKKEIKEFDEYLGRYFKSYGNCLKITGIARHNVIYEDRTFDLFVSKHKPQIINKLTNVKNVLNKKFTYNGFDHYNFGMILHGLPGTGKTVLCKMIANYMKRDIYVVNMKNIKTCVQFQELFWTNADLYKYQKYVYILDEFDCVQGALSRSEHSQHEETSRGNEKLTELRNEYTKTLLQKHQTPSNHDLVAHYTKECERIQGEIDAIQSKLDIYTLLSTFDGIEEMRGRIIIATTNYIDRIDSALLRPGRFDIKINLGAFERAEIVELLTKMFEGKLDENRMRILQTAKFQENVYTPADIMNTVFMLEDFDDIIKRLCLPK